MKNSLPISIRLFTLFILSFIAIFITKVSNAQETPHIDIVSPTDNVYVYGSVKLDAYVYGSMNDTVEWGIFKDTCLEGTAVAGNIQGKNDYYNYLWQSNRYRYETTLTVSGWEPGKYCFAIRQMVDGSLELDWQQRYFNLIALQVTPSTQTAVVGETAYVKVKIIPVIENLNLIIISSGVNNFTDLNFYFDVNGEADVPIISSEYGLDRIIGCADFNDDSECSFGSGDIWNSATIVWYIERLLNITSPTNDAIYFSDIPLNAIHIGESNDTVVWNIRKDNCEGELILTETSFPYQFIYDPANKLFNFSSELLYEDVTPGKYCFHIDPNEVTGNKNVYDNVNFYVGKFEASVEYPSLPIGKVNTLHASIGVGVENKNILFEITGANPEVRMVPTDMNGKADFSYQGNNPGTNQITICFDYNEDNVCGSAEQKIILNTEWYTAENPVVAGEFRGSGSIKLKKYEGLLNIAYGTISHISYSGHFESDLFEKKGNITITFHKDVNNAFYGESVKFKEFESVSFRTFSCNSEFKSAYFKANADKLGNGYFVEFYATDLGKDEKYDLVRIIVKNDEGNLVYDTFSEGFENYETPDDCTLNPSDQNKSITTSGNYRVE